MPPKITVAYGDGIGPEIMTACLRILRAAGAQFEEDKIEIGEQVYLSGETSGIRPEAWKTLTDNKIFLKAPITTPQGGGYKSLNVTVRKTLGLFSNVRPVKSLHPFVETLHPNLDIVVVRENEEDLYAGIEHRQTSEVYQCLKLITRPGSEKIVRYAFEYARSMGRKKVTCMIKDNIMKLTDGLFHQVFREVAKEYPDIVADHYIVDIGAARVADTPQNFDVIVLPNLYGDILSDIVAQIAGSVGLAGSSNVGENVAMFEAIHGSAPDIAGKDIANPSGLLQGAVMMLNYMGQAAVASKIENAWLKTLEDGIHTADIFNKNHSQKKVGTKAFADAVVTRLGEQPTTFKPVKYPEGVKPIQIRLKKLKPLEKKLEGVDVFVCREDRDPEALGAKLKQATKSHPLQLRLITNRGVKVYPDGNPETFCTDHWRCRFFVPDSSSEKQDPDTKQVWQLLQLLEADGIEVIKTENLYSFEGEPGYSMGQGQ